MALLTVQNVANGGLNPSFTAATSGGTGNTFPCDKKTFLAVKNGDTNPTTVTKKSYADAKPGLAVTDETVTVPAGETRYIRFDPAAFQNPTDRNAKVTFSNVTSVTVAAIRLT